MHGTRTATGQVFLVAVVTHDRGAILGQRQVPDRRGENAVIADLLTPLDVAGMMLVRTSKEIIHGIVSATADQANPAHLNHYARGHWTVHNHLHWTRDVTFREDDSQLRTGNAPRAAATLRNLALNTFRLAGRANIAYARRDLHDRHDVFAGYDI